MTRQLVGLNGAALISAKAGEPVLQKPPMQQAKSTRKPAPANDDDEPMPEEHGRLNGAPEPAPQEPPRRARKPAARPRFELVSIDALMTRPDPEWLIHGIVPEGSLAVLYGPPGCGKTFLALDAALSVAAGAPLLGRAIRQGDVVYVAAEGQGGLKARVAAWLARHPKADLSRFQFVLQAVNMLDGGEVAALIDVIRAQQPAPRLIVLDTLARNFGGGDENTAKDMNAFVASADRIRAAFPNAAVLVVHHTGKKEERGPRGSLALTGAADTEMRLSENGGKITLKCEKQKDDEPFKPIDLTLEPVLLYPSGSSCVLRPWEPGDAVMLGEEGEEGPAAPRNANEQRALDALRTFGPAGATFSEWRARSEISKSTFAEAIKRLEKRGMVKRTGDRRDRRYRLTEQDEVQVQVRAN